jgi:hypothetical protein
MLNNTENTLFCFEETSLLKAVQHNYPNISCLSYSEFIQSLNPFKSFSTEETEAELKNILDERGIKSTMYDPWIDSEDPPLSQPSIFFIGTNHDVFLEYKFPIGSTVIDPWRYIKEQDGVNLIKIGDSRNK